MSTGYLAGSFSVPGSTGQLTVQTPFKGPGLQGVIFFGSNRPEEDVAITSTFAGLFYGMMAKSAQDEILVQSSSMIPAYGQHTEGPLYATYYDSFVDPPYVLAPYVGAPIAMRTNGSDVNAVEYRAEAVAMNPTSFTVNFTTVAANRFVQWFAWGNHEGADAFANAVVGPSTIQSGSLSKTLPFIARSLLTIHGWFGGTYNTASWIRTGWGGKSMQLEATNTNQRALAAGLQGPDGYGQNISELAVTAGDAVASNSWYIGPFLGSAAAGASRGYTGSAQYDVQMSVHMQFGSNAIFAWWDGGSHITETFPPASVTGEAVQTVSPFITDVPEAILFFTLSGHDYEGTGGGAGVGFGVYTPDYSGCVTVNQGGYFYQSRVKSWCDRVDAGGAHAGHVTVDAGTFTYVTDVADASGGAARNVAFAFGPVLFEEVYSMNTIYPLTVAP